MPRISNQVLHKKDHHLGRNGWNSFYCKSLGQTCCLKRWRLIPAAKVCIIPPMGVPFTKEMAQGHPATTYTSRFEDALSGYTEIREAAFGGRRFPISLANERSLYIGQNATLRREEGDPIPDKFLSGQAAVIVGFNDPDEVGVSRDLIRVVQHKKSKYGDPVSIGLSNIERVFFPPKIIGDPEVGQITVSSLPVDFLFVPAAVNWGNRERIHVMAMHWEDRAIVIGDAVSVHQKEGFSFSGIVTGFSVELAGDLPSVGASIRFSDAKGVLRIRSADIGETTLLNGSQ